jgi:hypothetical protein
MYKGKHHAFGLKLLGKIAYFQSKMADYLIW